MPDESLSTPIPEPDLRQRSYSQHWPPVALLTMTLVLGALGHGLWYEGPGLQTALLALASAGALTTLWMGISQRARRRLATDNAPTMPAETTPDTIITVFHASETGYAEYLAEETAKKLQAANIKAQILPLGDADPSALRDARRALFIASTTGEGDPPDAVYGFVYDYMEEPAELDDLEYALLALGDSSYEDFCGFGRRLDAWLLASGARRGPERIDMDDIDPEALKAWHAASLQFASPSSTTVETMPEWVPPAWQAWRLVEREWLNPGSPGGPVWRVSLAACDEPAPSWEAGDLIEILPQHVGPTLDAWLQATGLDGAAPVEHEGQSRRLRDCLARSELPDPAAVAGASPQQVAGALKALRQREFSIGSIMADGYIDLLVRMRRDPDGRPGLAAGWLTEEVEPGQVIEARLRRNANFHAPDENVPLILVGNGTGLAGLRALLRERIRRGQFENWLFYGERTRKHDFHFGKELQGAAVAGQLRHLDVTFSRDGGSCRYVQHCLRQRAERVRQWVERGASIMVCGSLDGMAGDVDAALRDILGDALVQQLTIERRYRRDVY